MTGQTARPVNIGLDRLPVRQTAPDPTPAPDPVPVTPITPSVTLTAAQLAEELDITVDRAAGLFDFALARVEGYASGAPTAAKNESIRRYTGYLAEADFGTVASESVGPASLSYTVNHANAWRNSGAAGCLAPWRIRRAGAIG